MNPNLISQPIFSEASTPVMGWNKVIGYVREALGNVAQKEVAGVSSEAIISTLHTGTFDVLTVAQWKYLLDALQARPSQDQDIQLFTLFAQTFYGIKLAVANLTYDAAGAASVR